MTAAAAAGGRRAGAAGGGGSGGVGAGRFQKTSRSLRTNEEEDEGISMEGEEDDGNQGIGLLGGKPLYGPMRQTYLPPQTEAPWSFDRLSRKEGDEEEEQEMLLDTAADDDAAEEMESVTGAMGDAGSRMDDDNMFQDAAEGYDSMHNSSPAAEWDETRRRLEADAEWDHMQENGGFSIGVYDQRGGLPDMHEQQHRRQQPRPQQQQDHRSASGEDALHLEDAGGMGSFDETASLRDEQREAPAIDIELDEAQRGHGKME